MTRTGRRTVVNRRRKPTPDARGQNVEGYIRGRERLNTVNGPRTSVNSRVGTELTQSIEGHFGFRRAYRGFYWG